MTIRPPKPETRHHAAILGIGAYRPTRIIDNDEVCKALDSSDEWIIQRSGIRNRRRASPSESLAVMGQAAAEKALAAAGMRPAQVDNIIVATMSRLTSHPPVSAELAQRMSARRAITSDISAACAGFTYGVALARNAITSGQFKCVLVIGTERMLDIVDPIDRSTAFLFGDGAGAVVIGRSPRPGVGPVSWGTDGSRGSLITRGESWVGTRSDSSSGWPYLRMDGPAVFRWAVSELPAVAQSALERAGVRADELDAFIPHQANERIVDGIARALRLPPSVAIARDVQDMGNTSAASIPLAAARLLASGEVPSGGLALLLGFGAGLAHAAQVVRLP